MIVFAAFYILWVQLRSFTLGIQWDEGINYFNKYYMEQWNVKLDFLKDSPQFYRVWSIPNTNEVNLYGEYNRYTILGNKNLTKLYNLIPSEDSHVWYKDGLYFVASNLLWKYGYSKDVIKIEWNKLGENTHLHIITYFIFFTNYLILLKKLLGSL